MSKNVKQLITTKYIGGHVMEVKEDVRNGVKVGIIEGYIATWDLDRGNGWIQDQFVKGAFKKSIRQFKRDKRQVRFKDHHGRTVGGFPAESLKEDNIGLWGSGEINLEVQQGQEAYALAKQNVLVDFSVGFQRVKSTRDEQTDIRLITEAILWEGSIVDEPMNPKAKITAVKNNEGKQMDDITEDEVKGMTERDLEDALQSGKQFTKQAARTVASLFTQFETEEVKAARETADQEADELKKKAGEKESKGWADVIDTLGDIGKDISKEA